MERFTNKPWAKNMNPYALFALLTTLVTGLSILTAYQPIWANIPINVVLPIIVLLTLKTVFFEKLKLTTLLVMRILIILSVFNIVPGDLYVKLVLVFLCINILEATLTDLKRKKYCNVVTGVALIITVYFIKGTWLGHYYVATSKGATGMVLWIIAYTIWNWLFVINEFSPSISKFHIGVLAAPIIGCLLTLDPGLWLIFRGNSLTIAGTVQVANKEYLEEKLINRSLADFIQAIRTNSVQIILMLINLLLLAGMVIISISSNVGVF